MTRKMEFFGIGAIVLLSAAAFAFMTADAWAQGSTPATLAKVTLSGDAAKRALTKTEINADTAEQIVKACIDYAKAQNRANSVVVLSPSGDIVHSHRMDGQTSNNIDSAYYKAKTALYMRMSTHEALNRFNNLETQLVHLKLDWYLVSGGLPIIVQDQLIGAVGVGGGQDEQCAYEALTKVLGPQPPLAPNVPFGGMGGQGGGGGQQSGQAPGRGQAPGQYQPQ